MTREQGEEREKRGRVGPRVRWRVCACVSLAAALSCRQTIDVLYCGNRRVLRAVCCPRRRRRPRRCRSNRRRRRRRRRSSSSSSSRPLVLSDSHAHTVKLDSLAFSTVVVKFARVRTHAAGIASGGRERVRKRCNITHTYTHTHTHIYTIL